MSPSTVPPNQSKADDRAHDIGILAAEVFLVDCRNEFRAGFACAVWIQASERVDLAIGPVPFAILVDLVSRHVDHSTDR
jgi:hypothetical protein